MYKTSILTILFSILLLQIVYAEKEVKISSPKSNFTMIENVVWCGADKIKNDEDDTIELEGIESKISDILFMLTRSGHVFASNNHGGKWANLTQNIIDKLGSQVDKEKMNIVSIQLSPADPQTMFLFGKQGQSFIAHKCGKQLQVIKHDRQLKQFKLNRQNKDYLLAHRPSLCSKFDEECEAEEQELYLSKDMGKTFNKIADKIFQGSWDKSINCDDVPDSRMLVQQRLRIQGKNNDKKILFLSDDFMQNKKKISSDVQHFYQSEDYIYVATDSEKEGSYNIKVSPKTLSHLKNYEFYDVELPIKRNKDFSFSVLESYNKYIFLGINQEGHNSKMTNIYSSDITGRNFSLNLMNVVKNNEGDIEFERVLSNPGTFIANIYDKQELDRIKTNHKDNKKKAEVTDDDGFMFFGEGMPKDKKNNFNKDKQNTINSIKKSKISFNQGATWHSIKAPKVDSEGNKINCSGECSLHLAGRTHYYVSSIYSSENAHGIIIGTGNTGLYLEESIMNMNTYISSDGGHTWKEIKKHSHVYEIGDRGGVIVLGSNKGETSKVHYSWDQGQTWKTIQISDEPLDIISILNDHSDASLKFLIFGKYKSKDFSNNQGRVIQLDFSTLHKRECEGYENPGEDDSDYEYWSPKNFNMETCQLGKKTKFIRRKASQRCYNPQHTEKLIKETTCECTREDYQCAFGFYRQENDENELKCVPLNKKYELKERDEYKPPKNCRNSWYIPTGYEKIEVSACEGGVDLGPEKMTCPASKPKSNTKSKIIDDEDEQGQQQQSNTKNKGNKGKTQQQQQQQSQQQNNINQQEQNIQQDSNVIAKYGLIVVILYLLYNFKQQILTQVSMLVGKVVEIYNSRQQQTPNKNYYGNLNNNFQGGEDMGMLDNNNNDDQV